MTRPQLLEFMRGHQYAVQASVSPATTAQAAVVGIAVSDALEIVFDSLDTSRKIQNLRRNPAIALVIAGSPPGDERTVQYEGLADEPTGPELERVKEVYYARFPDGRQRLGWSGLVYVRVRPSWIRYSDFSKDPPQIVELDFRL
jgi:hypothetical protein